MKTIIEELIRHEAVENVEDKLKATLLMIDMFFSDEQEFEKAENNHEIDNFTRTSMHLKRLLLKSIEKFETILFIERYESALSLKSIYHDRLKVIVFESDKIKADLMNSIDQWEAETGKPYPS